MKNFHLPLPEETYERLRAEAQRTQAPATTLAREAIDWWLREQKRKARDQQIAAYAAEMAGTDLDLDALLEGAGIEHLVKTGKTAK
jgi:predicted DNA-binding protein